MYAEQASVVFGVAVGVMDGVGLGDGDVETVGEAVREKDGVDDVVAR